MGNEKPVFPFLPPKPNTTKQPLITHTITDQSESGNREDKDNNKVRSDWDFNLSTVISSCATVNTTGSDAIGVLEFDPEETLLATGGIARKIRIYSIRKTLKSLESQVSGVTFLDHATACDYYLCTPAKLSSLKWKPGSGSRVIGSGDYDGVVTEYDLEKRVPIFERDEHGGRRVWSMDYSNWDPNLGASGSDDGTMQMWDSRCEEGICLASVQPNRVVCSPVCCVEFNPFSGPVIAVGCADKRIYGYDLRRMDDPVFIMDRHEKAVTYVRYFDSQTVLSSSVDGSLMMWRTEDQSLIRTYKGHANSRRFVGLSVWRNGGLLSCGSEDNQVFVYDMRWGDPIWVHGFESRPQAHQSFVSSVCWRQAGEERCTLVAGGSDGVLQFFEGLRKSSSS